MSIREQIEAEVEAVAGEVKSFKAIANTVTELHQQLGAALSKADTCLRMIQSKAIISSNEKLMDQLSNLLDSCEQVRRNRNQMDLGTFVVKTDRVMDAVWKSL